MNNEKDINSADSQITNDKNLDDKVITNSVDIPCNNNPHNTQDSNKSSIGRAFKSSVNVIDKFITIGFIAFAILCLIIFLDSLGSSNGSFSGIFFLLASFIVPIIIIFGIFVAIISFFASLFGGSKDSKSNG